MKHYVILFLSMVVIVIGSLVLVQSLGIGILTDPGPVLARSRPLAAPIGVGLLIADILIPVPSSIVMIAHGAVFGPLVGTLLSMVGCVGAGLFGFFIGRRGGRFLERLVPEAERRRANALLGKWGGVAIVATRPVPILAETIAVLAGTSSSISWKQMSMATTLGSLPAAVIYAVSGAAAVRLEQGFLIFAAVLLLAAPSWILASWLSPRVLGAKKGESA